MLGRICEKVGFKQGERVRELQMMKLENQHSNDVTGGD